MRAYLDFNYRYRELFSPELLKYPRHGAMSIEISSLGGSAYVICQYSHGRNPEIIIYDQFYQFALKYNKSQFTKHISGEIVTSYPLYDLSLIDKSTGVSHPSYWYIDPRITICK